MAEYSYFFNALEIEPGVFDREYQAQDFADYFGDVLSTGLLHTDEIPALQASVETGTMNTIVSPGKAIMRGHRYWNTTPKILEHSIPEADLDRIDRIVLRLDLRLSEREILLHVKEGESSTNPVAPELQRDQFIYEISLAQIYVHRNTSTLQQVDLIDERLDENVCGLVNSLLTVPTSQFQEQWDLFFSNKSAEVTQAASDYIQALLDAEQALQDDLASFNQQWDDWFSQQQTEGFVLQPEFNEHLAEKATRDTFGHVKIGGGLEIEEGILSNPSGFFVERFDIPGTYTWTVPQGVSNVFVTLCAGSGGGGGGGSSSVGRNGGTGGVSSFGSYISTNGGSGGRGGEAPSSGTSYGGYGGNGGTVTKRHVESFAIDGNKGNQGEKGAQGLGGAGANSVTMSTVAVSGKGGTGGQGDNIRAGAGGGGSGATGEYIKNVPINVTPGESVSIFVGAGGKGAEPRNNGGPGEDGSNGFVIVMYAKVV